jgi:hypothetical protein
MPKLFAKFPSTISTITPSWALQRWGIDIVGPLTTAQGNYKYAVVAVEYFAKWIEAKHNMSLRSA